MIFYKVFEDSEAMFVVETRNIYKYSKYMPGTTESVHLRILTSALTVVR